MPSQAQDDALHAAYVKGRNAYLNDPDKGLDQNPYPIQSPYYDEFEHGFNDEKDKAEK